MTILHLLARYSFALLIIGAGFLLALVFYLWRCFEDGEPEALDEFQRREQEYRQAQHTDYQE